MKCMIIPRNPALPMTFARYEYNTIVFETTLIRQNEVLESKETAEKKMPALYYSVLNYMIAS